VILDAGLDSEVRYNVGLIRYIGTCLIVQIIYD